MQQQRVQELLDVQQVHLQIAQLQRASVDLLQKHMSQTKVVQQTIDDHDLSAEACTAAIDDMKPRLEALAATVDELQRDLTVTRETLGKVREMRRLDELHHEQVEKEMRETIAELVDLMAKAP